MFKVEEIAKLLYHDLTHYISEKKLNVKHTLEGAGVHWNCICEIGNAKVTIYSCDLSSESHRGGYEEEFIVSFFLDNDELLCGRSYHRKEVIESVENWLLNKSKSKLYTDFKYVDRALRKIQEVEEKWLSAYPSLKNTKRIIENHGSGLVRFEINNSDRACGFTTVGEDENFSIRFSIDQCILFESKSKSEDIAQVLYRFLVRRENLSNLSKEFDWLMSNDLVKAYENGNGLEGEFINSWDTITTFYQEIDDSDDIVSFICDLRSKGFDKTLRAGQSLYTFILSRSRRHGLLENQKYIMFSFQKDKMIITYDENVEMIVNKIEVTSAVEDLLHAFSEQPIEYT